LLSEGDGKKFPSIKEELENLENKRKVLELNLEGGMACHSKRRTN
jgi:hypothetical protein